jgi:hypothetical protein
MLLTTVTYTTNLAPLLPHSPHSPTHTISTLPPSHHFYYLFILFYYILERFMKRYNLPTRRHLDPVRIREFNRELTGEVDRQIKVPLILEVEVGRTKLDLVTTDVNFFY